MHLNCWMNLLERNFKTWLQKKVQLMELASPGTQPHCTWKSYQSALTACADSLLLKEKVARQPWISQGTLELIQVKKAAFAAWKSREEYDIRREEPGTGSRKEPGTGSREESEHRQLHTTYRQAVNACKQAVRKDKRLYWKKLAQDLDRDFNDNKIHAAYKKLGMRDEHDRVQPVNADKTQRLDGTYTTDIKERLHLQRRHFQGVLNCQRSIHPAVWSKQPPRTTDILPSAHPPSLEEVQAAIASLKNFKAAGICKIAPEMIKYGGLAGAQLLHKIITEVWETGKAPLEWKQALLVPLLKKGDPAVLNNYRGISLLSVPGKVYSLLIGKRLQEWAESSLLEMQCGFRKERGCNDAIFVLKSILEQVNKKKKPGKPAFAL